MKVPQVITGRMTQLVVFGKMPIEPEKKGPESFRQAIDSQQE